MGGRGRWERVADGREWQMGESGREIDIWERVVDGKEWYK